MSLREEIHGPTPGDRGARVILWGLGLSLAISALVSGKVGKGPHTYLQLLLLLLFASYLALRLRATGQGSGGAEERGGRGATKTPCPLAPFYPLGILLALSFLSLASTVNYALTVWHFHQWIGYGILAYLMACGIPPGGRTPLIRLMVSLGGLLGLYGIYQHFWGFPQVLAYLERTGEEPLVRDVFQSGRVFSAFLSPDMLAGYLSLTIPLGLASLAGGDRLSPRFAQMGISSDRLLAAASLVFMLVALYLARSLGGWLSLLASLGLWGFIGIHRGIQSPERRKRYRKGLLVILLGGLVLVGTVLWARALYFFEFSHPDNSLVQRWRYWESAAHIIADFPISGSGLGTFGLLYPYYKPAMANETQYTHNGYLQLAAELGLPGLFAFLWAVFIFLRRGWNAFIYPADRNAQLTAWGLLAAGTAFLFHSLVDYGLSIPQVAFSWWAIFGLTLAQGQSAVDSSRSSPEGRWKGKPLDLLGIDPARVARGLQVALFLVLLGLVLSIGRESLGRHYYQKAREAVQRSQLEEADRTIRRAIALAPLDDAYHYFSARLSSDRMRQARKLSPELVEQALRGYGRAIELNPYYSFYYRDRGLFYLGLGQEERATRDLSAAVDLYPTNGSHRYHLALVYKSRGELKRAETELRKALRLQPGHGKALRELAWTLFSQRKMDAALPFFEQLARLHPQDAQARVDLGWAYGSMGQHQWALEEYEAAIRQDPKHVYAWVNRGWSLYQLKEYPQAEEAYRKALNLEPNNLDARVNLILLYIKGGEAEKARAALAEALRIAPRNPRLMGLRQELSKTRGNHE